MIIIKICSTCKENKPISDYYTNKRKRKDGSTYEYVRNECKKCTSKRSTKWGNENRERKREHWRKYASYPHKKKQQVEISRQVRESGKYLEWLRNNKDKVAKYRLNRAHKNHDISKLEWDECKKYFDYECAYCGISINEHYTKYLSEYKLTDFHKEHFDHEGNNNISNCVPSCKTCNSYKHVHKFEEWYNKENPIYNEERLNRIYKWINEDVHKLKQS